MPMVDFTHIILPGSEETLLRKELALAFARKGLAVTQVRPEDLHAPGHEQSLPALLAGGPCLLCSINGAGLGSLKTTLPLLEKTGSRAVIWFVDNPWNVLSSFREPQWRDMALLVTDHSFIPGLKRHGASHAGHMPLAACPETMAPRSSPVAKDLAPLVFVGRSAFPGKDNYFAGQSVPPDMLAQAVSLMGPASPDFPSGPLQKNRGTPAAGHGPRPDFNWWLEGLGMDTEITMLWPGKKNRKPAFGAETCSLYWRGTVLDAAASAAKTLFSLPGATPALDIFGDAGWQEALPAYSRLHLPVDYYTRLPGIYSQARYSLAITSLQLPAGLNQRHFDIWMAGGVCLTDATPGLDLFPQELVHPIRFFGPDTLPDTLEALEAKINRPVLIQDWQNYLRTHHTYAHRAEQLLAFASLST